MFKKHFILLLSGLIFIGGISYGTYRSYFKEENISLMTIPVVRMDLEETVLASGTLHAFKTVEVGAQVSGQLERLHFQLGEEVKKGDLLAEIDPVLQQNDLKEAMAEQENMLAKIEASKALLKQNEREYKRQKTLFTQDATSRADLESAQAQYETTRADLDALKAQLKKAVVAVDSAKANLSYTRISAPMDGVIISIDAEEGQTLVSSQAVSTIMTLANLDKITVKAEISEADVTKVKTAQKVYFTVLGDPDKRYYGTLRAVEPAPAEDSSISSSSEAVYYNGLFDVDNLDRSLRVGMTAQVTIILEETTQTLAAPVSVLGKTIEENQAQIEILENGRPISRTVRTGLNNKVYVEFLSGVSEGEQLVIHQAAVAATQKQTDRRPLGPPPGRS